MLKFSVVWFGFQVLYVKLPDLSCHSPHFTFSCPEAELDGRRWQVMLGDLFGLSYNVSTTCPARTSPRYIQGLPAWGSCSALHQGLLYCWCKAVQALKGRLAPFSWDSVWQACWNHAALVWVRLQPSLIQEFGFSAISIKYQKAKHRYVWITKTLRTFLQFSALFVF